MLAMWGYNTLSRNKTSSFDDIIATANQSEKKIYSIANGQLLYLIICGPVGCTLTFVDFANAFSVDYRGPYR